MGVIEAPGKSRFAPFAVQLVTQTAAQNPVTT
jgi:hypothetical protein